MSANDFINWYAAKFNIDFPTSHDKLYSIRAKSPKLYKFLLDEFNYNKQVNSKANIDYFTKIKIKSNIVNQRSFDASMSRMAFDSNIPVKEKNIINNPIMLTDMDSIYNIAKEDFKANEDEIAVRAREFRLNKKGFYTEMVSFKNIPSRIEEEDNNKPY